MAIGNYFFRSEINFLFEYEFLIPIKSQGIISQKIVSGKST